VPPGNYLILGEASIFNNDADLQTAECDLSTGDQVRVDIQGNGPTFGQGEITLHDSGHFSGLITMKCSTFKGTAVAKLSALAVDAIF
jgi:hypothetical protein